MKKGESYYSSWVYTDPMDKNEIHTEEWIVSSVDVRGAFLIQRVNGITWGKLSTKNGDFGLILKNVPTHYRKFITKDEKLADHSLYKTKEAAYKAAVPKLEAQIKKLQTTLNRLKKLATKK